MRTRTNSPLPSDPLGSGVTGSGWGKRELWLAVALVAAVFAAYAPAWRGEFLWDDDAHVTKPELRSAAGLARIWTEVGATQQYYPVLHSAFWLQHRVFGDGPTGYHLVTLALHAANALLLLVILRRLRITGAWLAAGIFALHPVMVESVAWITELKNTLSGFFYLAAAWAWLRYEEERRARDYAVLVGLFLLALGTKTVTATLPAALLVLGWWRRGELEWRRDVRPLLPLLLLGAGAGLFTAVVERDLIGAEGEAFGLTLVERGLLAGRVGWFYAAKLLWPADLLFIYPRWEISQAEAWQFLFPALTVGLLSALWWWRRRSRAPLAGALFFGGTLFPVLGFFNVYPFKFSYVADHFQYLASLGVIVLAAAGWENWATARLGPRRWVVAGLVLGILGTLTWRQSALYRDPVTLYQATLARNPDCWMAHINLGRRFTELRRLPEAVLEFSRAVALRPAEPAAHYGWGTALALQGDLAGAIERFEAALRLQPGYTKARANLGSALAQMGRLEEAAIQFAALVRVAPDFAEGRRMYGLTLLNLDRPAAAVPHLAEAVRLNPADRRAGAALEAARKRAGPPR